MIIDSVFRLRNDPGLYCVGAALNLLTPFLGPSYISAVIKLFWEHHKILLRARRWRAHDKRQPIQFLVLYFVL